MGERVELVITDSKSLQYSNQVLSSAFFSGVYGGNRCSIATSGGEMSIESTPGQGARLEITIPQKGYESYG